MFSELWTWFGSGVDGSLLFFCQYFLAAGVFWSAILVWKSACVSKAVWLQPRITPFVVAVVGTEQNDRETMGLDGWQDQTRCPLLGRFVVTLVCRLDSCSFLRFGVMILAGVILTLRLDSSGIKKGEFRTGHPQTLNKNAVAWFMNSRCQFLHPKIYFLLWFLFKKGCAWVMNSSWWGLTAQHYATKMNNMYAGVPGMAQQGVQPGARSHFWGFYTIPVPAWHLPRDSTGMFFIPHFPKQRASQETWTCWFSFQKVQNLLVRMIRCPLGKSCRGHASSSRQSMSSGCR